MEIPTRPAIPKSVPILLGLTLVLAAGLRLALIGAPLSSDELAMVSIWGQMPFARIVSNYQYPNNHIFLTLIESGLLKAFGANSALLRLPVLACGLLSVLLGYYTALRVARDSAMALGVAFLLAISPAHIYYSANARGYLLLAVFAQAVIHWILTLFGNGPRETFTPPDSPLRIGELLGLGLLLFLGTWTVPTFALFEGSLGLFFASQLLARYRERLLDFRFPCVQILLTLLACLIGLYFQYGVLISREMLNLAVANSSPPALSDMLPRMAAEWLRSFEPFSLAFFLFAAAGLAFLYKSDRNVFFLTLCVLPFPPAAAYLAVKSGAFAFPPHGRVFFYLQPFLFICASMGARALAEKAAALAGARFPAMAPSRMGAHILFGALFVPLAFCAAQDLKNNYYPERAGREPLHKVLEFVKTLGPQDLFLTSNGPHVEFYLYGADAMRQRVNNIVAKGELSGIYFLERRRGDKSDVDRTVREGVEYLELKDYSQINPLGKGPAPLLLPSAMVETVARFDNLAIHKIRPQYIKKAYSLKTPEDMGRWLISAESPVHLESFRTADGAQPVIAFKGSIVMLSKLPQETAKDGFG
ncbi:MAG: hypothetical protein HZA02_10065, partial [Nitrospinae bacterium]|nr:hypothetical protein [Nitrospinota bacterium]